MSRQIPFPLPHEPSFSAEDFLVTPCNADAAQAMHDASRKALLLLGPKGSGKTHMGQIWRHIHGAAPLDFARQKPEELKNHPAWLWDDADRTEWTAANQEKAFHILNCAREDGVRLLIIATTPPRDWPLQLADLRSRLLALPVAAIQPPDDALVGALLVKHFSDRQLRPAEDVVNYILPRVARDGGAIMELVEKLDRAALADQRAITIPLVKGVMEQ